jgi:hypothetical protein
MTLIRLEELEQETEEWAEADKAAFKAIRKEEARRMWLLACFQRYPFLCPSKGVPLLLCERLYMVEKKLTQDLQPFEMRLDAIRKGDPAEMHAAPPVLEAVMDITPKLVYDWSHLFQRTHKRHCKAQHYNLPQSNTTHHNLSQPTSAHISPQQPLTTHHNPPGGLAR